MKHDQEFRALPAPPDEWADLVFQVVHYPDGSKLVGLRPYKAPTHPLHMGAPIPDFDGSQTPFLDAFFAVNRCAH